MDIKFKNFLLCLTLFASVVSFIYGIIEKNIDAQTGWFVAILLTINSLIIENGKNGKSS